MKLLRSLTCLIITLQFAMAQFVNVQGVIRDNDKNTIPDGEYTITFKLYSAESGGSASWTEEQTLTVINGVYGVELGTVESLTGLNWDTQYWLEIASISGADFSTPVGEALSPRTRMTMTPYAIMAGMSGTTNVIPQDGNVGIGTTSPSFKLHVAGDAQIGSGGEELKVGHVGHQGWAGIANKNSATSTGYALIQNSSGLTLLNAPSGQRVSFRINNSDKMTVASNGNVGIGTTSPAQKLHVNGNSRLQGSLEMDGDIFNDPGFLHPSCNSWECISSHVFTSRHYYGKNSSSNVYWAEAGNTNVFRGRIFADNSDIYFTKTNHDHTGTGNTSGYAAIENAANYHALMILGRSGGEGGGRNVEIWDRLQVNGSLVNSSDGRLKKEITTLPSETTLSKLLRLRGVTYKWKEDKFESWVDERTHIGFIAQEIAQEYPGLVSENGIGTKAVNYISMIPVLLEGIKEVKAEKDEEISELTGTVNELTETIEILAQRIEELENK